MMQKDFKERVFVDVVRAGRRVSKYGREYVRKYWKDMGLFRPVRSRQNPRILKAWVKKLADEYHLYVWLIAADTEEEAAAILEGDGWDLGPTWNTKPWDCTGEWYHDAAEVKQICPGRVMVKQYYRLDV